MARTLNNYCFVLLSGRPLRRSIVRYTYVKFSKEIIFSEVDLANTAHLSHLIDKVASFWQIAGALTGGVPDTVEASTADRGRHAYLAAGVDYIEENFDVALVMRKPFS